jgi:O-antigen/teichoic acid export membrane protein
LSLLKKNILANFGGQFVTTLVGFLTVPFYIKYLGQEGYGLVSFFISLQAITAILDWGLSTTANREISKISAMNTEGGGARNLIRTLEVVYFGMCLFLFLGLWLLSDWIATRWLRAQELSPQSIRACVLIAGATLGLRWPVALYHGILRGLEKQITLNLLFSALTAGKALGSILVLIFLARTVVAFYWCQLAFAAVELVLMWAVVWRNAGGVFGGRANFKGAILQEAWRFAFNIGWVSFSAVFLKQLDKVIVSALLPIEHLGFYTTATMAGMGISKIFLPVQIAVFPRFTKLLARNDLSELGRTFHQSAQTVAFLTCPAAALLIFFAREVLLLWTRSADVAGQAASSLTVTALAMIFNSMMSVPFMLQLAAGLTWLPLCTNALGAVVLAPMTYWMVLKFGIAGGALAWLTFNVLYYAIVPQILFRHVLQGHKRDWFLRDTLPFIVMSLLIFGGTSYLTASVESKLVHYALIVGAGGLYSLLAMFYSETIRSLVLNLPYCKPMLLRFKQTLS